MDKWIVDYTKYTRPYGQLEMDLGQARRDYVAYRAKSKSLMEKLSTTENDTGKASGTKGSGESTSTKQIEIPTLPERSIHGGSRVTPAHEYPWIDHHGRSVHNSTLFFVGLDGRKATLTLGYQGWDCGIAIAKDLKRYDPTIVPVGSTAVTHATRTYDSSVNGIPSSSSGTGSADYEETNDRMKKMSQVAFITSSVATVCLSLVLYRRYKKMKVQ